MTTLQKTIGDEAEEDALKFLTQKGLRLLEKKFACKLGEIDLIMQDSNHIVFVEVRARKKSSFGRAADSITPQKIKKIVRTATIYLQRRNCLHKVHSRFDVVTIDFSHQKTEITWFKNAFTP